MPPRSCLLRLPRFPDGNDEPVRVRVLGDASAKHHVWFLDATDTALDHPAMKFAKLGNVKPWPALPGVLIVGAVRIGCACVAQMERNGCTVRHEFRPV